MKQVAPPEQQTEEKRPGCESHMNAAEEQTTHEQELQWIQHERQLESARSKARDEKHQEHITELQHRLEKSNARHQQECKSMRDVQKANHSRIAQKWLQIVDMEIQQRAHETAHLKESRRFQYEIEKLKGSYAVALERETEVITLICDEEK